MKQACESDSITITDLSSYLINGWTVSTGGNIYAYKYGGMCTISGINIKAPSESAKDTLQLPDNLKPYKPCRSVAFNDTDNNNNYIVQVANGKLQIARVGFTDWYTVNKIYSFNITYPCIGG